MALITLENMRFHAYHGVYEAERTLGTEYLVEVTVKMDIEAAAREDNVNKTINYETIYQICRLEMDTPRKLIESVVIGIADRMKNQFPGMEALRIKVRKVNPPLGGPVDSAWVEEVQDFGGECPRCKSKFIRYNNNDCWERFPNLHPATREMLAKQYGPRCLCDNCLKFYAG